MTLLICYGALALLVSFVCSLLEASLLSLPRSHVELMVEHGSRAGERLKHLKENIDQPLAAILTLNTIAHTVGAAGVGAQAAVVFGSGAVGLASALMTLAVLVLSEIIPKTLGAVHARSLAGLTAWVTTGMIVLCYPVIVLLESINRLIRYKRHGGQVSRWEVFSTIRLGGQGGALAEREHRIAMNVLHLAGVRLSEILTPRVVLFSLPAEMTAGQAIAEHHPMRFSRIPLTGETVDQIDSYATRFDIHKAAVEGKDSLPLAALAQPLMILPELASVADALEQMLAGSEHIALVVDEYGGIEGIVTLEDLLESLLGQEITDETDLVADMRSLTALSESHRPDRPGGA